MSWVHFFFHNIFSILITDSKVLLQKSLKWSFIYLCLESHPCLCYFVRLVHWCQVWRISAQQLFRTVPRRLVQQRITIPGLLHSLVRKSQIQETFPGDCNHDVHKKTHSAKSERFGLYGCSIFLHAIDTNCATSVVNISAKCFQNSKWIFQGPRRIWFTKKSGDTVPLNGRFKRQWMHSQISALLTCRP